MEEWKKSFQEIYGRSPTAGDISIAPNSIKVMLQSEKKTESPEKKQVKKGIKRKNFEMKMMKDEQFSPVKKRVNLNKLGEEYEENPITPRTSPRKKLNSFVGSPMKTFAERNVLSPKKRSTGAIPFEFDDFSPMKSYSGSASKSAVKNALTPIKSPTKRSYQRQLSNRDFGILLLPTPEKFEEEEEELAEEFGDETSDEVAKARAHKPAARRLGGSTKSDQNFQKINLRKKQFVRGKVTAEQKRKMKRKQMFRKKT